jgi:hypothetical protein
MSNPTVAGSGDGSRPTTSGGVDNIGGGEKFSSTKNAAGEDVSGPAPQERMQAKRKSAQSSKRDDSAALGLTEDLTPVPNREPAEQPQPQAQSEEPQGEDPQSREEAIRRAAYEAYERRGGQGGDEHQDWLDAEAEVDRQRANKT